MINNDSPSGDAGEEDIYGLRPRLTRRQMIALGAGGLGLVTAAAWSTAPDAGAAPMSTRQVHRPLPPQGGPVVNVRDHGALGDGVTDDVDAFTAAMQTLAASAGGTLLIPPGTYLINKAVVLTDNVHILGHGATLTKTAGPHSWFVSLSGDQQGYGSGVKRVKAEGLTFRGSFADPLYVACGFALHHAQDVIVQDCTFTETQCLGHHLDLCGCERVLVRNCTFRGFHNWSSSGYNKVECIELDQSRWGALSFADDPAGYDGLFTRDVWVEDCRFLPLEAHGTVYPCGNPIGAHASREDHRYENVWFTGNHVADPMPDPSTPELDDQDVSASWKGVTHFPTVRNLTVANNTFTQHAPGSVRAISVFSIDVSDLNAVPPSERPVQGPVAPIASENITITGNHFIGFRPSSPAAPQEVIWMNGVPGGPVRNVTIADNTFTDERAFDGRGTFAVRIRHGLNLSIVHNTAASSAGGVLLEDARRFTVVNNEVSAGAGPQLPAAVDIAAGSARGTVVNNTTDGFEGPVAVGHDCRGVTVRNNR